MKVQSFELKPFTEESLRILDEEGRQVSHWDHGLTDKQIVELYRLMWVTRLLDERTLILQKQGKIAFYASSAGQEAAQVGSAYAMEPQDWIYPSHREQGVFITRGMPLEEIFGHFMSRSLDPARGRQMPGHLGRYDLHLITLSSPVSTQIPQAVGTAYASKYRKESSVTMTYFGDGGTSEGAFHEGLNFAAVFQCPVVFFCQNNQYAISVPLNFQMATKTIAVKACAYGFDGFRVDGNDVLAVYSVTHYAVQKARSGQGPTLIEAVTYRYAPHSSADDDKRYRRPEEVEDWQKKRDPIKRLRLFLIRESILSEKSDSELLEQLKEQVMQAYEIAERSPHPPLASFLEDVYAEEPWFLKQEKQEFVELYQEEYERGEK